MFLHDAIYRVRRRLALWSAIGILSAAIATITSLQANRRPNGLEVVLYVIRSFPRKGCHQHTMNMTNWIGYILVWILLILYGIGMFALIISGRLA